MRAVIVDDHPLARVRLKDLLNDMSDIECVGEAKDGKTAIALIRTMQPDLVFLDIHMPDLSGLDVLRRCDPRPLAVFTTAYNQYAVTAFELHALDYLLKPFGSDRLRDAVERARSSLRLEQQAMQFERAELALNHTQPLARVFIRQRGQITPVSLDQVEHLEARGDYVALWQGTRSHLLRARLAQLCNRLDQETFFRIHRSHVINLTRVKAFSSHDASRVQVELETGKRVLASRSRSVKLRERLAF